MQRLPWFKVSPGSRTDQKLQTLTDAQFRVWFNLLCYAAEQPTRGTITGKSAYILAVECARGATGALHDTLKALQALQMIDLDADDPEHVTLTIRNWEKWQRRKPSEEPEIKRQRVQASRDRAKAQECSAPVAPCSAQKRPKKRELEKNNTPLCPPNGGAKKLAPLTLENGERTPQRRRRREPPLTPDQEAALLAAQAQALKARKFAQ